MNLASELSSTASRSKELAYLLNTKKRGLIYLTSIRKIRKKRKNRERETRREITQASAAFRVLCFASACITWPEKSHMMRVLGSLGSVKRGFECNNCYASLRSN